jgi:hypothetical protein
MENFSIENFNVIWQLKKLESLELWGIRTDRSILDNLHKLKTLKRLKVDVEVTGNILDHLKFGVFNNLEELDGFFQGFFLELVREMKQITPNLKKIWCQSVLLSDRYNALLEALEHLEALNICVLEWELNEKVYPKITHLQIYSELGFKIGAEQQLPKQLPNLKFLKIDLCRFEATDQFFITLLSGLKQLKTLIMNIWSYSKFDPDSTLLCFREYGGSLESVKIVFGFVDQENNQPFTIEKKAGESFYTLKMMQRKQWLQPIRSILL